MNQTFKRLFGGFIVWFVPFFVSLFVWDVEANAPSIGAMWFNALMAVMWAIGFGIAAYYYFGSLKKNKKDGCIKTGFVWYVEMLLLDYLVLVMGFGMAVSEYYQFFVVYLNVIVMSTAIGYLLEKN